MNVTYVPSDKAHIEVFLQAFHVSFFPPAVIQILKMQQHVYHMRLKTPLLPLKVGCLR